MPEHYGELLSEERFLWLCRGLGERPLPWENGYLLSALKPKWARLFVGCVCRRYHPESVTNPRRERVETTWWRPPPPKPTELLGANDEQASDDDAEEDWRMLERDVPTTVLHIGDYDPSGVALFESAAEDVTAMFRDLDGVHGHADGAGRSLRARPATEPRPCGDS
jgi:hypothetical protein